MRKKEEKECAEQEKLKEEAIKLHHEELKERIRLIGERSKLRIMRTEESDEKVREIRKGEKSFEALSRIYR